MESSTPVSQARERLLRTAADLFYREGIHSVGVDRILADANVTRSTMYRHFAGKEGLVEAYLALEDATIRGYFSEAETHADPDTDILELVIDGIAEDIARYHTRGCPFINAAAEYPDPDSKIRKLIATHRNWFRGALEQAAAGRDNPADVEAFVRPSGATGGGTTRSRLNPCHILTDRSIIRPCGLIAHRHSPNRPDVGRSSTAPST